VERLVKGATRIVLVEHVVLVVPHDQAIGVVQPVGRRREVIPGALWVVGERGTKPCQFLAAGRPTWRGGRLLDQRGQQPVEQRRPVFEKRGRRRRVEDERAADADDRPVPDAPGNDRLFAWQVQVTPDRRGQHFPALGDPPLVARDRNRAPVDDRHAETLEARDRGMVRVQRLPEEPGRLGDRYLVDHVGCHGVDAKGLDRGERPETQQESTATREVRLDGRRLVPRHLLDRPGAVPPEDVVLVEPVETRSSRHRLDRKRLLRDGHGRTLLVRQVRPVHHSDADRLSGHRRRYSLPS
jgi:hypothetical protein